MDRPRHGFDRNGSHSADAYVCDCGYESCGDADYDWMDWADQHIEKLEAKLEKLDKAIMEDNNG